MKYRTSLQLLPVLIRNSNSHGVTALTHAHTNYAHWCPLSPAMNVAY